MIRLSLSLLKTRSSKSSLSLSLLILLSCSLLCIYLSIYPRFGSFLALFRFSFFFSSFYRYPLKRSVSAQCNYSTIPSFFFLSLFLSGKFDLQQQSEIARDDMFNVIDSSLILIRRM